jgi:SH3-like domain-containing protein
MKLLRRFLAVTWLLAVAAAWAAAADFVVIVPVANMFRGPDNNTDVVSQAIYGTNISLIDEKGEWKHVRTPDEYTGWIHASALRPLPAGRAYAVSGSIAEVWNRAANVYRETNVTAHAPLLTLPFETHLEVVSTTTAGGDRWLKIRLPDENTAWIQSGDVLVDPKPLSIADTIELARRFLGVTYTWGGTSSFGYDCSGFMQMLVRHRGRIMPRDADLQAAWDGLTAVPRDQLQPGDLLYFGRSPERITHTGMYIGDGKFINDTTYQHPMVQIGDLNDEHWSKALVAARRLK